MFHINLYNGALEGELFVGLTFAIQLWFVKSANRPANRFLAVALFVLVFWIAGIQGADIEQGRLLPQFTLAFGPLIYFYVRKAIWHTRHFHLKDLLHFCPVLLVQAFWLPGIAPILKSLTFISVGTYLYLSHRLIERFYASQKFKEGDRHRYEWRWLNQQLSSLSLVLFLWMPLIVIDYFGFHFALDRNVYYPLNLLFGLMVIRMSVVVFFRPETDATEGTPLFPKPSASIVLKQKGNWLKKKIEASLLYQDPDLSVGALAEQLDIPAHELSRIINGGLKKNFSDLINEYRIRDVVAKMLNPAYDHITLLGIAYESGFNSKTTFNRTFKEITGKSPAEYKNELKKERPFSKMERLHGNRPVVLHHETTFKWSHEKINRNTMFRNYLKIAWRNIIRHKTYSVINVAGLAVGFAAFLLIFLVVRYEQSFDQFHVHEKQLFRVIRVARNAAHEDYRMGVPFPVAPSLRSNFPQLANAGAIVPDDFVQVIISDNGNGAAKRFREVHGVFFAEPHFFDMFSFSIVAGEYRNSLKMPGNVLLTKSLGDKYFGHWQKATGKMLRMDGVPVKVCGILKDLPANTDFPIKAVLSYATHQNYAELKKFMNDWGYIEEDNYCFVQLNERDSQAHFKGQLKEYSDKYIKPVNPNYYLSIQPLNEMHFDARYGTFDGRVFSENLIIVLSTIGLFLLVVACVNFINLSTAQAVNRAREIGVRKVLGSNRRQLILQFLGEAALISCFAFFIALAAVMIVIPAINNLLDIHLTVSALYEGNMLFFLGSALAAVTLLAGFYPAFLLSGFNPARVLKSTLSAQQGGISLRRGLVIFQFFTAQALIIVTIVMVSQMSYVNTADMGFNKEAILTAQLPQDSVGIARQTVLHNELMKIPGIEKVSLGMGAPIGGGWFADLRTPDNVGKVPNMLVAYKMNDTGFFNLFHLQFIAGRPYYDSDSTREFVVSENVIRKLGYQDPQRAIGERIIVHGDDRPIVGVVKDFHIASLRDSIVPVVMSTSKRSYGMASVKLNLVQAKPAIIAMQKLWDKYYPDFAFTNSFLDQDVAAYYRQETQLSKLYKLFAVVAIFISCLGLYGLVTFMAVQRKKEIGVRKVLGAPVSAILVLLSWEFTLLIGIAFLLAAPVAWYFMHNWLKQYAYRINLGPGLFVLTIIGSILVAWASVGYTAIKAALANPARSLRNE
jgi:putative ABC transport system permease protein